MPNTQLPADIHGLKIVILDNPLDTWDSKQTQHLFRQMVSLKLEGYRSEYPKNVLPLDASDFFGTHLMICKIDFSGDLIPLVAYKAVTLERCESRRQPFPPRAILKASQSDDSALVDVMDRCRNENIPLSYDSAWTMNPKVRENREFSKYLRDITTTIGVFFHQEFKIPEWIVMGIKRFKTDQYFQWMGHADITREFRAFASFDEPAKLLHLKKYSDDSVQIAQTHSRMWQEKLLISADRIDGAKETLAA